MKIIFTALFFCLANISALSAQGIDTPPVAAYEVPMTRMHKFHSNLLDENIKILVGLPFGYQPDVASYPIVFHTDGETMFAMGTETLRLLSFEQSAPQAISVSIAYEEFSHYFKNRRRDYHPSKTDPETGGIVMYHRVLAEEIIPFVKEHYAVADGGHVLYGHSSGSLLGLYTALATPTLFEFVLASSPSVEEEIEWVESLLDQHEGATPSKLYISLGELEVNTRPILDQFVSRLREVSTDGSIEYDLIPEMPHMAAIGPAYASGMRYFFANSSQH